MDIQRSIDRIDQAYDILEELKTAAEKAGNEKLVDELCTARIILEDARLALQ